MLLKKYTVKVLKCNYLQGGKFAYSQVISLLKQIFQPYYLINEKTDLIPNLRHRYL
jgi:hypothetical protein